MTEEETSQQLYRIAFGSLKGMNYKFACDLLSRLGNEEIFFKASTQQLKSILGFDNNILDRAYRDAVLENARGELTFIREHNVEILYFTDHEKFPQRLAECDDAPALLFSLGENTLNSRHIISIVGTRHATVYGVEFVKALVSELAKSLEDVVIVSGLAYGIDVTAHKESVSNDIPTVGVLAHGLSTIYPSVHRSLAATMIKKKGMLLTEYFHSSRMYRGNFVARNRIVAGLADCTVVVESAEKGGAMITAGIASGYNRDVFALPGRNTDRYSRGCNRLIAQNQAALIQSPEDLIDFMGWDKKPEIADDKKLFYQLTDEEQKIIDFLTRNGEGFINRIAVETGIGMHRLMGLLVDMEFKHLIVNQPGGLYRLA